MRATQAAPGEAAEFQAPNGQQRLIKERMSFPKCKQFNMLRLSCRHSCDRPTHPIQPLFWWLKSDGVWTVRVPDAMPTLQARDLVGFLDTVQAGINAEPCLVTRIAARLLDRHFRKTLHLDILYAVGLPLMWETSTAAKHDLRIRRDAAGRTCAAVAAAGGEAIGLEHGSPTPVPLKHLSPLPPRPAGRRTTLSGLWSRMRWNTSAVSCGASMSSSWTHCDNTSVSRFVTEDVRDELRLLPPLLPVTARTISCSFVPGRPAQEETTRNQARMDGLACHLPRRWRRGKLTAR
jgi:hypothetical protein